MKTDIFINNYPMYGLNHNRRFLKPVMCECGCGQPAYMVLKTDDDVKEFCCAMLQEYDCPRSVIFAVFNDGRNLVTWKEVDEDDKTVEILSCESDDIHMFSDLDGEMRFCCYSLIMEEDDGLWMIQE